MSTIPPAPVPHFAPTYAGSDQLPWTPFTPWSEEVEVKVLHLDLVRNETTLLLRAPGNAGLGRHNHYGRVLAYTVRGSWRYAEHGWTARPGDFVYEVADSAHTLEVGPDGMEAFIHLDGPIEFLGEDDTPVGMETAHTFGRRYEEYCAAHGLTPVDLSAFSLD